MGRTQTKRFWELFSVEHARRIDGLVAASEPRMILLSKSLVDSCMRPAQKQHGVFSWLPERFRLGQMKVIRETEIVGAPHFSSTTYTKADFAEPGSVIRQFCG